MKTTIQLNQATAKKARGIRNTPLQASVQNGVLFIAIGVETLAWASVSENGGPLEETKVLDADEWAQDVCDEIMKESNGFNEAPACSKWLDQIIETAADRGSAALK